MNQTIIQSLLKAGYELDSKVIQDHNHYITGEELTIYAKVMYRIDEPVGNRCY